MAFGNERSERTLWIIVRAASETLDAFGKQGAVGGTIASKPFLLTVIVIDVAQNFPCNATDALHSIRAHARVRIATVFPGPGGRSGATFSAHSMNAALICS